MNEKMKRGKISRIVFVITAVHLAGALILLAVYALKRETPSEPTLSYYGVYGVEQSYGFLTGKEPIFEEGQCALVMELPGENLYKTDPLVPLEEPKEGETIVRGFIARNETIIEPMLRAGLYPYEAERAINSLKGIFDFRRARPNDYYDIRSTADGRLVSFRYKTSPIDIYQVTALEGDYKGEKIAIETQREIDIFEGAIKSSLFEAVSAAGGSMQLAVMIADVFSYDIDFYSDPREGDLFHIIYEKQTHNGEVVSIDRVLAASYEGKYIGNKTLYFHPDKKNYYDYNGTSATKAFLRSPLKFTRISSRYGNRFHPITRKWHFHGGVDYAAPTGTPVQAVGDGQVTFAGTQGNAGKMIKIQHRGGYESMYLHLSKIFVKQGSRVSQKTTIGHVGSTGRSTGPHLDFRLKHKGKYINPLRHVAPRTPPLGKAELEEFRLKINHLKEMLDSHSANADALLVEAPTID